MKKIFFHIILVLLTSNIFGQNLLGYKSQKIEKYMDRNYRYLVKDRNSRNEYYKYLKYTDGASGTTTMYFFLSEDDKCSRIKRMHVHSMKDEVINELDSLYRREEENIWSDRRRGTGARIKLVNEEWFFTITIEPEIKK